MEKKHCCPWWIGYLLINPLRKISLNPNKILKPYIKPGMRILEFGPGMGFFTPEIARLCGESGRVIAVDIQKKMLDTLRKRMKKKNLDSRLETLLVSAGGDWTAGNEESIDFLLAAAVVHEVPDQLQLFKRFHTVLKKNGRILFAEPKGHVNEKDFQESLELAEEVGFTVQDSGSGRVREALLIKK